MREDSLEEFEAVFEHASIPVLNVEKVAFPKVVAVFRGGEYDQSVLNVAKHLKTRFGSTVTALLSRPELAETPMIRDNAALFDVASEPFESAAALLGQISLEDPSMVLVPIDAGMPETDVDKIIHHVNPPILLIRQAIDDPERVFDRILHSLTGNFQQSENFSAPFSLVRPDGAILLLHAIAQDEIEDVNEALEATTIKRTEGQDLLEAMSHHGERFLKGVVLSMRDAEVEVNYRIAIGQIGDLVGKMLSEQDFHMLVVGHHEDGKSHVTAADYQLIHTITSVPVLAL